MTDRWPWRGDSMPAKLRRIAEMYRAVALMADPEITAQVDRWMVRCGEAWIAPHPQAYAEDELITRTQAAELLCIKVNSVTQVVKRRGLTVYTQWGKGPWYRAGDIYELISHTRGRNAK